MSASKATTSALASRIVLSNGLEIPRLHLGVYMTEGNECEKAVTHALEAGYRGIDSAAWYYNETEVGRSINEFLRNNPGITREDVFFTTKLQSNVSYEATKKSIMDSITKSGLGFIDLYLLHSPYGGKTKRLESWRAVMDGVKQGKIKSAGVSNFGVKHLRELLDSNPAIKPVVNQVEVHPFNTQTAIVNFCANNNILVEAYAPLARAMRFKNPTVKMLSEKYKCTPAQLMVKWSLQKGYVALPKSVKKERIISNVAVDNFTIGEDDIDLMDSLDEHLVTDWDPTDCD